MIEELLHPAGDDVVTMICGPAKMRRGLVEILKELGHDAKSIMIFY